MSEKNENKNLDDPIFLIFIFFTIIVGIICLWYFIHEYVATGYVYLRYIEILPFWIIGKYLDVPFFNETYEYIYQLCRPDRHSIIGLCTRDMSDVTIFEMMKSSITINIILISLLIRKAYVYSKEIKLKHPKLNFCKEHNIDSFIEEQKVNHKHLRLYSHLNLIDEDIRDPLFGMSLTVREFCYKHKLFDGWKKCDDGSYIPTLDYRKTEKVLVSQLGELWTGNKLSELKKSEIILLAVALPRVAATDTSLNDEQYNSAMKESKAIRDKLWDYFNDTLTPDIDTSHEEEVIVRYYKQSEKVRKLFTQHAYIRTIIYRAIIEARRLGVLSAADLSWLQFYDREMFFFLSTIGRQTAFPESCAVLSHFLYEARMGEGYPEPLIDKAIEGLKYVITDVYKFTDEDIKNYNKI